MTAPAKNCDKLVPWVANRGRLEDLDQIETGIAFHDLTNYLKSMPVGDPRYNAQSKRTTAKLPAELRSARELKIKAAIEQGTQRIVAHMRKQILTGQNGL